jgi:hypothetical protein
VTTTTTTTKLPKENSGPQGVLESDLAKSS